MTPTPTFLLLTFLFWTLPASAAVLTYRAHDNSFAKVKHSLQNAFGQSQLQPKTDS